MPDWRNPPVRLLILLVLGVAAAYVGWHLDRGWVPGDEGSLAHAAQRVLLGELPHRDFDDVYTGGLAYVNAAAFQLLGTTLWSMRLVLFAVFVAWVPAVFYVASRFARQAGQCEATVDVVRQHARGEYIWASPDVPQLYFLSGYRNPTRPLFEFFDDTTGRSARVLRALDEHQVNLVVPNVSPQYSPRISLDFYRALAKRYPNSALVEPYLVKWPE
jgi:hypothetical protein